MSVFKQLIVAILMCAAGVGGWVHFTQSAPSPPGASAPGERTSAGREGGFGGLRETPARVVAAPVVEAEAGDRLTAIATAEAARSVTLYSRTTGIVEEVAFRAGDAVRTGDALVRLDDAEERLALERAQIALRTAEDAVARAERLSERQAISAVQLEEAHATLASARNDLATAELALERRTIAAPFDGIMGFPQIEVGDMMTTSMEIATVDDRSTVVIEFRVPERFAAMVEPGTRVEATTAAFGARAFAGEIEALDSRLDAASRTLAVRAGLANEDDLLRPGMAFSVDLDFETEGSPAVPKIAVQWDRDGAYVWKIVDGKARRTPVRVVRRTSGAVLVDGDLALDDMVVAEGFETLREGAELALEEAGASRPADS